MCALLWSQGGAVHAQQFELSQVPANVSPGAVIQGLQQRDQSQEIELKDLPPQEAEMDYTLPPLEDKVLTGPHKRIDVYIDRISVNGLTLLKKEQVEELTAQYEQKRLEFGDLEDLANKITQRYREKGYVTSRAYIPGQKVEGGLVQIDVLEGRVGEMYYNEGQWFKPAAYAPRINISEGDFLNIKKLGKSLRRINEHPDFNIKTSLRAGENPGDTDLNFTVEDKLPLHASFTYDNLGRKFIGHKRIGITAENNNLLGYGDRLLTNVSGSRRSLGVASHYELDVWKYGTKVGMDYARSSLRLGDDFRELQIEGKATVFSPFIVQPIYQDNRWNISSSLFFDFKKLENRVFDSPFSEDRLRVLRPTLTIQEFDKYGSTMIQNEVGIGICVFECTTGSELGNSTRNSSFIPTSRLGAGSRFVRWHGTLVRLQRLPLDAFSILRVDTQLSPDLLVSAEQMQVGGSFSVRGFREGRYIGDSGLVASTELHLPLYFIPRSWRIPMTNYSLRDNIQAIGFLDFGATYTNDPPDGQEASEYLMGIGFGVRAKLTRFLTGRFDIGWPILRAPPDTARPRVHFGIQSSVF